MYGSDPTTRDETMQGQRSRTRIGVISDTHGVLRPQALDALAGVDLIIHAGDVGDPQILDALSGVAPVRAVRGNMDRAPWADSLPDSVTVQVGRVTLAVVHDESGLRSDPAARGLGAVIVGHTHRPRQEWRQGVLYFNPGAAGSCRATLPASVGLLTVNGSAIDGEIVLLEG
jgi:uncharacterized protein